MADFNSRQIRNGLRYRPTCEGKIHSATGTITIRSGQALTSGDVIRLFRVDPSKMVPLRLVIDVSGALDADASQTIDGTIGLVRSVNRSGDNISFKVSDTATAMVVDADMFVTAATVPEDISAGTDLTDILADGGVAVYDMLAAGLDSRGYDANVADVAITLTGDAATAPAADRYVTVTLEYMGVPTAESTHVPYAYTDRYDGGDTSSI